MKVLLIPVFMILFAHVAAGQSVITGTVANEDGKMLANATITVENPADSSVIGFGLSNTQGQFRVSVNSKLEKLLVRVRLLTYANQFKEIDNKTQEIKFTTWPQAVELKEVTIRPAPISARGDTLSYDPNAFAAMQDRSLADVVKRMPGFEVSEDGQISFQGESINRFYVENKDLMGGRYGTVTNALPHRDISRIEVLQNHQPVKALQGLEPSVQPAINIKLKKQVTYTGRGDFGAGFSPAIWNVSLTPMIFSKDRQAVVTYKSNNSGDNLAGETGNMISLRGMEGRLVNNTTGSWLGISGPSTPAIPMNRYLFNNAHSFGINGMTDIGKGWETRLNGTYMNDHQTRSGGSYTEMRIDGSGSQPQGIRFTRHSDLANFRENMTASFNLAKNDKNNFVRNMLTLRTDRNSDRGPMIVNDLPVEQRLASPGYSLQNTFSTLFMVGKKQTTTINFRSFINYINENQDYSIWSAGNLQNKTTDLTEADQMTQFADYKSFELEKEASVSFRKKDWNFRPGVNYSLSKNELQSRLSALDDAKQQLVLGNEWFNNVDFTNNTTTGYFNIALNRDNIRFSLNLPVVNYEIKAEDTKNHFTRNLNKLAFEPSSFIRYAFNPLWTWNANAGIRNNFATIRNLYPAFIFSGLNFNAYDSDISETHSKNAGSGVEYKNTLTNVLGNISARYSTSTTNIMLSQSIAPNGLRTMKAVLQDNKINSQSVSGSLGKYFTDIGTNVSLSGGFNRSTSNNLINNILLPVTSKSQNAGFRVSNNKSSKATVEYSLDMSFSQRMSKNITTPSSNFMHDLKLFIYPVKNNTLRLNWNNSTYKTDAQRFTNNFLDLIYQYNLEKRKMDFEIKWMNILNTKTYEQAIVSAIETTTTYYTIRPSQVLFSVRMNLRK